MLHCLKGIVPNLYEFVLWNIKDILKNVGNQTISDHRLQLFRQKTLKHLSQYTLCSTKERKSFRFRTTNYVCNVKLCKILHFWGVIQSWVMYNGPISECFEKICFLCFISWTNNTQIHNKYPSRITNGRRYKWFINHSCVSLHKIEFMQSICKFFHISWMRPIESIVYYFYPSQTYHIKHDVYFDLFPKSSLLLKKNNKIFSTTFPQQLDVAHICAFPPLRRK